MSPENFSYYENALQQIARAPEAGEPELRPFIHPGLWQPDKRIHPLRTEEVSQVNDYRNPKAYENPYGFLAEADKLVKEYGIEFAREKYYSAIDAAKRINQTLVRQDMADIDKSLADAEAKLKDQQKYNLTAQQVTELQRLRQYLTAHKEALTEIWLSPATTLANCAFASIRSGNPEEVRRGENFLRQACEIRPEIKKDPHFLRHYREAYMELARKTGTPPFIPPLPGGNDTGRSVNPPEMSPKLNLAANPALPEVNPNRDQSPDRNQKEVSPDQSRTPESDSPEASPDQNLSRRIEQQSQAMSSQIIQAITDNRLGMFAPLGALGVLYYLRRHRAKSDNSPQPPAPNAGADAASGQKAIEKPGQELSSPASGDAAEEVNRLVKAAESETDPAKAREAVVRIVDLQDLNACHVALRRLASGHSAAAPLALESLLLFEDPKDIALAAKRWKDGEVTQWWKEGRFDGTSLFRALAASELSSAELTDLFRKGMDHLKDSPHLQAELCSSMIKQQDDFLQRARQFPDELRKEALTRLLEANPPDLTKRLERIGPDDNPQIFREVKEALDRIYEKPGPLKDGEPSRSKLFDGKLTENFIASALKLDWREPGGLAERYHQYQTDTEGFKQNKENFLTDATFSLVEKGILKEKGAGWDGIDPADIFDKPDQMRKQLESDPKLLTAYNKLVTEQERLGKEREYFDKVVEERRTQLKVELDKLTDAHGLPRTELDIKPYLKRGALGSYAIGANTVRLLEKNILTDGHPKLSMLATVAHEVVHHEQSDIITRWILDQLKIDGKPLSEPARTKAKAMFLELTGYSLEDGFLDAVVIARAGKTLNEHEAIRASSLAASFKELSTALASDLEAKQTAEYLRKQIKWLEKGHPRVMVTGNDLKDARRMLRLFGVEKAPLRIQELDSQLKQAYENKQKEQAGKLEAELTNAVKSELESRLIKIELQSRDKYRRRFHEEESHAVDARATYLGEFQNKLYRDAKTDEFSKGEASLKYPVAEPVVPKQAAAGLNGKGSDEFGPEKAEIIGKQAQKPKLSQSPGGAGGAKLVQGKVDEAPKFEQPGQTAAKPEGPSAKRELELARCLELAEKAAQEGDKIQEKYWRDQAKILQPRDPAQKRATDRLPGGGCFRAVALTGGALAVAGLGVGGALWLKEQRKKEERKVNEAEIKGSKP